MKCEMCIHYGICVVNSYCHEPCGYYEEDRPHGEWKKKTEGLPHLVTIEWFVCSECGVQKSEETPFCPNCGSQMAEKTCDNCFLSTGEQCDILVPSENCKYWKPKLKEGE